SKALLAAAKTAQGFREAGAFGIAAMEPQVDFSAVQAHVRDVIGTIEPHDSVARFEGLGVKVFRGAARFKNSTTIEVNGQEITARHFAIATGSRAVIPKIAGLDPQKVLTNENIFELREKPEHLIIIGGGPIGMEMAQAHRRLGCAVTVLDMGTVLPKDDQALAAIVRGALEEEGVTIIERAHIREVIHGTEDITVHIEKDDAQRVITGSHIMAAAGRAVNVDGLGLEQAGVAYDAKGIRTDKRLRTSRKHIFAAGDVTGGPQFTHVAGYHAGIIIRNIIFKIPAKVNYSALPWVTYTDPELAHAGMTEAVARAAHGDDTKTVTWKLKENDRAQAERRTDGMIKVVTRGNGRIIGASIAAPGAGEMIGLWTLAISQKMKIGAVAGMIAPYPTISEISKRAAGVFYTPALFSARTRRITGLLRKLPF
ncbi:MAG TPA: FAD-dependent oxidoreductase, partial [Alphaproteobacteria bacterium]